MAMEGDDLPKDNVSNKELDAIKCLLKQLSISVLFDTGVESTTMFGGSSKERELAERDFMARQNLLGLFKLSVVWDK